LGDRKGIRFLLNSMPVISGVSVWGQESLPDLDWLWESECGKKTIVMVAVVVVVAVAAAAAVVPVVAVVVVVVKVVIVSAAKDTTS